jgi:hypothetical protein
LIGRIDLFPGGQVIPLVYRADLVPEFVDLTLDSLAELWHGLDALDDLPLVKYGRTIGFVGFIVIRR